MPKKPRHGDMRRVVERQSRARTVFLRTGKFDEALEAIKPPPQGQVWGSIQQFERIWKESITDEDIPRGYTFKSLHNETGCYSLLQIYIKRSYRAIMMSVSGANMIYWLHVWHKHKQRDSNEVERAKITAKALWQQQQK